MIRYDVATALGCVTLALEIERAPLTAGYFARLFDASVFHNSRIFRIVTPENGEVRRDAPIDVVQLGHFDMDNNPQPRFAHESTAMTGLGHARWRISAARGDVGHNYPSFFVCMRDEPELDFGGARHPDGQGFAVFGRVTSGFEALQSIRARAESGEFLKRPIAISTITKAG